MSSDLAPPPVPPDAAPDGPFPGEAAPPPAPLFLDFFNMLRDYGVPIGMRDILDFYRALEKGVVESLEDLFLVARLSFVRRVEHMDAFERAFLLFFEGIDIPRVAEGDLELLNTKQFQKWLAEAIRKGEVPKTALWTMDMQELMRKFWETVREQMEEHHGGNKWVGTGGTSPFGHSGNSQRGVRVGGGYGKGSALKVVGDRRYIAYSESNQLRGENIRQALDAMKHMKRVGARDVLDLDETIRRTARDGGEIDLVFDRQKLDRISVVLMIDNGGYSMNPYIDLTRTLFSKLHDRFKEIQTLYFHNTIYGTVWTDQRRTAPFRTARLLEKDPETRVVVVGDASMAPEELESAGGAISFGADDAIPSIFWLKKIADRFKHSCWLNPINRDDWADNHGQWTLTKIRAVFHMQDMTLRGIKGMVKHLTRDVRQ